MKYLQSAPALFAILAFLGMWTGCGSSDEDARIPIEVENCVDLGSLQASIHYDVSVLQFMDVKPVDIGENAMIEVNTDTPGTIILGLIDSSGINGDGGLVELSFEIISSSRGSQVSFGYLQANDANTLVDIPANTSPGEYRGGEIAPLVIVFSQ